MFHRAFRRVNTFKDIITELVKGKEKRAGEELIQEITKKQKVEDNKENEELKRLMETILDEEEVAIDVIPLDVKSSRIVDWKIHKEGKKSYYRIGRIVGIKSPLDVVGIIAAQVYVNAAQWEIILRVLRVILVVLPEHPVIPKYHSEDGNPTRANIKQALGRFFFLVTLIASSSFKSSSTKGDVLEGGGVSSNVTLSNSLIFMWFWTFSNKMIWVSASKILRFTFVDLLVLASLKGLFVVSSEYECSSLALDERLKKKRLDHLQQDQTMNFPPVNRKLPTGNSNVSTICCCCSRHVNTARPKVVINRRNRVKDVQASASWVSKSVKHNSSSIILKRYDYVDVRGRSRSVMAWVPKKD
uniref:Uncharacterized protein n=1 Tax=Tanacetum cinerariifolium TaxID=118510 RepID=A0A6L2L1J6_TANCI|nr:hypothetical protein [Tanacetum cinerariifolium]